jgi:hypothetical protein
VLPALLRLQAGTAAGWLAAIFWLAAAAGLALLFRRERRLARYTAAVVGGHVAGLLILSPMGLGNPTIFGRYLLPALPFVLLWVASAFGSPWRSEEPVLVRRSRGAAGALLVLALAAASPFADPFVLRTSFLHPNDFVAFHRPYRRMPAAAAPPFYRHYLHGETVLEAPWVYAWESNRTFYLYQQVHGGRVAVVAPQRILFRPPLALRNAFAPEPEALCRSGARYLIVHRNLGREEDRLAPGGRFAAPGASRGLRRMLRGSAAELGRQVERQWGRPVYADRWLRVWDLREACGGGGTQRTAAAASARAAMVSPAAKLAGR